MSAVLEKWRIAKISDFAKTTSGGTPSRANPEFYTGNIPWIKSGDLNDGNVSEATEFITEEALKSSSAKLFPAGTLMIALYGATIGKLGILTIDAATNQAVCGIFVPEGVETKYLFYFLLQHRPELIKQGAGGAQPNISQGIIRDIEVPLPPLPEQRRIVARIEELFSRLDAGVAALRQAKAQLRRYRQSVLAAAVTGQLTQAWREQHPDTEPAEDLLKRILKQRREQWNGRGKYTEPVLPDDSSVYVLPTSWSLATIDQLQSRVQHGSSTKTDSDDDGVPVLRMGNILEGALIWDSLKFLPCDHSEFPELLLESGDLLFNRTNSPELVGKTAVFRSQRNPCSFASYLIRVRFLGGIFPEFVAAFINSHFGRAWIKSVVTQQVGQANVNGTKLRGVTLPLPPLAEQHQIIAEVEARTTAIDHLEAELDRQITRSNRLRQSILASAFSGTLNHTSNCDGL